MITAIAKAILDLESVGIEKPTFVIDKDDYGSLILELKGLQRFVDHTIDNEGFDNGCLINGCEIRFREE